MDIGSPTSVPELLAAMDGGSRTKFLFFWSHHQPGAGCLSQWAPVGFTVKGTDYPTAEHWMMARKADLFGDTAARARILAAGSPGAAKALGRSVRGFTERTWQEHRLDIVVRGCVHKFAQHPRLRDYLLGTGNRVLVEASPVDRIWGIGLAADDEHAQDPASWRGDNLLGFALMRARAELTPSSGWRTARGAGEKRFRTWQSRDFDKP
ncbi:NADAR family protein [Nocardiopsis ansamitocini]|uniref:NADAR domain-containing protein n=1 Tax=Nocardiopsis ansamitocini TaxID=1670832 RepID=A0A9W6P4Q9_9ACTN|nr:NADAR family protein [Nocardiopsis ansamitocini]GLU47046.1 hypothetical protein Nans01_13970 [Nocardiopsis ansamitocini]